MFTRCFLLLIVPLLPIFAEETDTEKVLEQLRTKHNQLESYFAVYQGTAPNGKSLNATILYHGEGRIAAVQAQFMIHGQVVVVPLQATTPELGMIFFDQEILHLHDADTLLTKLTQISATLYNDNQNPLGNWTPALSLTNETAKVNLTISSLRKLPWLLDEIPEGTICEARNENFSFQTPEGANYLVDSKTGLLLEQNFPNAEGERTLVLKEQQINLNAEVIETFVQKLLPLETTRKSLREHSLFNQLQLQMLTQIIERVDEGKISLEELVSRLNSVKLEEYLQLAYPDAASFIATEEEWKFAIQEVEKQKGRTGPLMENIVKHWQDSAEFQSSRLLPETESGKKAAEFLTQAVKDAFLKVAMNQALE